MKNDTTQQYRKCVWRTLALPAMVAAALGLVASDVRAAESNPLVNVEPTSLAPKGIVGKDPTGAEGVAASALQLTAEEEEKAKAAKFKVGIVMQTMDIDWSTLQVKGITDTLQKYGAEVIGVIDPQFKVDKQIAGIENMIQKKPSAIISIPVDDTATAPAYKKIGEAGIKLVLMDNVPRGLKYPTEYQSMISSDNQGDGEVAAKVLSKYIPNNGTAGILGFGVDFFVTAEREAGFKKWLQANRPDIKIKRATFLDPSEAGNVAANFLTANPDVNGIFTVWEVPALGAVSALREQGKEIPIGSINLALEVAMDMASNGMIKGVGAQVPYDQGVAEALATLKTLLGESTPQWIVLPALPVLPKNVLEGYRQVFHTEPPAELAAAYKAGQAN
jgi:ribose transport system substrate-binding protein